MLIFKVTTRVTVAMGVAFVFLAGAWGALAQGSDASRSRALSLAREGRCDVALTELAEFRNATSPDLEVEQLTGECALRQRRFRLAVEALERVRRLDPDVERIDLHLAIAYFHFDAIPQAELALRRAERVDASGPEFLLYSGLVALAQADFRLAAGRFDAASQLTDRAPEPMASFYLGRALSELKERAEAEAAFDRVMREFPDSNWAAEARRAREKMQEESEVSFWASAEIGFEHDDNVLLRGRGVGLPTEISGQSDQRGFWYVDLGTSTELARGWIAGAILRYGGSEHHDLDEFDTHAPGGTLWLDRTLGDDGDSLRLQYDLDAAIIDNDPFLSSHLVTASFFHPWDDWGHTIVAASATRNDYDYDRFAVPDGINAATACDGSPIPLPLVPPPTGPPCSPPGVDEKRETNRTGLGVGASVVQHLPVPFDIVVAKNGWLEGGYAYQRYWAEGEEYDLQRHQVSLEAGFELPLSVMMRVGGRYARVLYDSATVFPNPQNVSPNLQYALGNRKRRETETGVWVVLERQLVESMVLSASYRRTRNRSNADVFDYARDVFGLSLKISFGS